MFRSDFYLWFITWSTLHSHQWTDQDFTWNWTPSRPDFPFFVRTRVWMSFYTTPNQMDCPSKQTRVCLNNNTLLRRRCLVVLSKVLDSFFFLDIWLQWFLTEWGVASSAGPFWMTWHTSKQNSPAKKPMWFCDQWTGDGSPVAFGWNIWVCLPFSPCETKPSDSYQSKLNTQVY